MRLVSSTASATLYAGWVAFCARQLPWMAMAQSALAQWLLSFAATFAFSAFISRRIGSSPHQAVAVRVAAWAMLIYAAVLLSVHTMIGTPDPLLTLLPVLGLAGAYALFYARLQVRHNAREQSA
ncbi:hypothetical protein [Pseudomonas sp. FW300-N2F2]|uniref:hypothetical protein n=1 Tax=Pseudomonas sp. FW300-N2F2 TaxID=2751320 RepID=UPI001A93053C|nr:hypothetical protein [Pseudomonas sp. FW300-N2F2]